MIEAQQLSKMFGSVRALDKVSFKVRKGEVVGFLGPNGAGKSTTMRILTCFISGSSGTARVRGVDVFDDPLEVRKNLGYLPQRAPLYGEMRVWDYLRFAADMRGIDSSTFKSRMKQVVEVCGLAKMLGKDIKTLSHGYRQRVGLGQALIHNPPILILDEPTSDLDPNEKAEVIRYIKEIGQERTILLSTHNLAEVEAACARAIIVSKGRVVADGSLEDMRSRTGQVRYVVTIDEKNVLAGGDAGYRKGTASPPTAQEVQDALGDIGGLSKIVELPTDDATHTFQMVGSHSEDARADLYKLAVEKGWILLEMRREMQTLEDVFMSLTRGDERADRGRALLNDDEAEAASREEEEELDEEEADGEDEDEDEEDDESEAVAKSATAPPKNVPPKKAAEKAAAKAVEEEEDDEEDEDDEEGEADEEDEDEDESSDEEDEEEEEAAKDKAASKEPEKGSKSVKKA